MRKIILFIVAVYIRLSREDGDKAESESVENQRKLISDFLKGKDEFVLYDIYIDDGFTGTNFNRPNFQRMIADIEAGKVNCVIVKDLSRFGRDYIDTGRFLERYFPDNNVRFISITDNIDSFKQSYDMLMPIKNIFNEQYARDISKKVHASMTTKQKNGEFIGAFASYGYKKSPADKNKLIVDEYAAGIVRKIFKLYIAGYGKIRIASMLNEEGIVCPSEYKKLNGENYRNCNRLNSTSYWTYSTIDRILQNQMYTGNMVQGRTIQKMRGKAKPQDKEDWIIVKGTHEAVIDEETWNKAQDLLKRRTRNLDLNSNMSIFAGFLKCGDCGRALVRKNQTTEQGKKVINYYCGTYVRSGRQFCTPHPMPYSVLEKIIMDDLKTIIQNVNDMQAIIKDQAAIQLTLKQSNTNEKKRLMDEIQKITRLKKSIYEDYREDLLSRDEYISYKQEYASKENLLQKQLQELEQADRETPPDTLENPWIKRLLEMKDIERLDRDIIVEMIHSITVYENRRIQITYNFSNELETLFKTVYTADANIG